jgi:hypothetical protein
MDIGGRVDNSPQVMSKIRKQEQLTIFPDTKAILTER